MTERKIKLNHEERAELLKKAEKYTVILKCIKIKPCVKYVKARSLKVPVREDEIMFDFDGFLKIIFGDHYDLENVTVENVSAKGCKYCDSEYNTVIWSYFERRHTSGDSTIERMKTKYCPNCGRKNPFIGEDKDNDDKQA